MGQLRTIKAKGLRGGSKKNRQHLAFLYATINQIISTLRQHVRLVTILAVFPFDERRL